MFNLGLKSFNLYMNMCNVSKILKFVLFGDNTNIFYSSRYKCSLNNINIELQNMILGLQLINYHETQTKHISYFSPTMKICYLVL